MNRSHAIARYVVALKHGADSTSRTEDRSLYVRLLSDAAVLLAVAALEGSDDQLFRGIAEHARLRGQIWLQDPVHEQSTRIWNSEIEPLGRRAD